MRKNGKNPLQFPIGQVVATPAVLELGIDLIPLLQRHVRGDWGLVDAEDWAQNDASVHQRLRIFSAYEVNGQRIWIITEADRSSTCILLPSDY